VVEFRRPFVLRAQAEAMPAGRYVVHLEEEMLEGLSFPAWRRTSMTISRHGLPSGRLVQALPLTRNELSAALDADGQARS
jgi:hypothetical protein